jgi:hypothetical protein
LKFQQVNSPDKPGHEVLSRGQGIAFGGALQLSIINLDRWDFLLSALILNDT